MCALGKCYGVVEACTTPFSHHMTPLSPPISADNAKTTALHHKEWLSWQNKHPMSFICQPQRGNKNVQLECSCSNNQQMTIMPTWREKQTTKDQETQLSPHLAHQSTSLKPKLRHMPRKLFHLKLHNKLLSPSHSLSLKPKIVAPKAFQLNFHNKRPSQSKVHLNQLSLSLIYFGSSSNVTAEHSYMPNVFANYFLTSLAFWRT